jgi:hypothetical protein
VALLNLQGQRFVHDGDRSGGNRCPEKIHYIQGADDLLDEMRGTGDVLGGRPALGGSGGPPRGWAAGSGRGAGGMAGRTRAGPQGIAVLITPEMGALRGPWAWSNASRPPVRGGGLGPVPSGGEGRLG